jgi:hypothetical protein
MSYQTQVIDGQPVVVNGNYSHSQVLLFSKYPSFVQSTWQCQPIDRELVLVRLDGGFQSNLSLKVNCFLPPLVMKHKPVFCPTLRRAFTAILRIFFLLEKGLILLVMEAWKHITEELTVVIMPLSTLFNTHYWTKIYLIIFFAVEMIPKFGNFCHTERQ